MLSRVIGRNTPALYRTSVRLVRHASTQNHEPETPKEDEQAKKLSDELQAEVEKLREENEELRDKYRRALAETENLRRRTQRQIDDAKIFSIQSFCKGLVEVADVLDLAVDSMNKSDTNSSPQLKTLVDGVVMTKDVLHKVFNKNGLVVVSPEGQHFDPSTHEAIFQVPKEESKHEPGHVHQVLKVGYALHGRPIRAAQVVVVKS